MARGRRPARAAHVAGLVALLAVVLLSAWVRTHAAFADPNFDRTDARGMLRSDPALLTYITERIVEAGGGVPDDFRADPRVQHPETADLPAMFAVGQEFLVAWAWRAVGSDEPLHVFCVRFFAVVASLVAVGVYGLAFELTRRVRFAVLAALVWVVLPIDYRTIGFVLIREDLALPAFALHLWLAARAARVRSVASFAWAGAALALALSTWHAMVFVVTLEMAVLLAWTAAGGANPLASRRSLAAGAVVAVAALLVPVLRAKLVLASPPVQIAAALWLAAAIERRREARGVARLAVLAGSLGVAVALGWLVERALGTGDYRHVSSFLVAKLRHLGRLPADPSALDFDARLLWQGPFATASARDLTHGVGGGLLLAALAAPAGVAAWVRRRDAATGLVFGFTCLAFVAGVLVSRTLTLVGLALPVLVALAASRSPRPRWVGALAAAIVCVQGALSWHMFIGAPQPMAWYAPPPAYVHWMRAQGRTPDLQARRRELRQLVDWFQTEAEPGVGVAGDFVTSAAVLAHSRHPIALQPKYETRTTRLRIREFYETFLSGTPGELRRLLLRWQCRYLLVDSEALWAGRWIGGLPYSRTEPLPGTAAAALLPRDPARLTSQPGFRLVWWSPPGGLGQYAVYEVE